MLYYIWQGFVGVGNWFIAMAQRISTLDTVLSIALISGAITVVGLIANVILSIRLKASEHRNKIRAERREKMLTPYTQFISIIFDLIMNSKSSKKFTDKELLKSFVEFSKEITLHGSNKVVKKWAKCRNSLVEGNLEPIENMLLLEDILYAIRTDLGIKKKTMRKGDILSLFVNDTQELINKKGSEGKS